MIISITQTTKRAALIAVLFAFGAIATAARADEGMWLFSAPPLEKIKADHNVELSQDFLEHLQKSCLKFANSGTASFVSSNGLILTNHHVGLSTVASLSTKERNLVQTGFCARSYEEELKCPDLKLILLQKIEDVTDKVEEATKDAKSIEEADAARAAIFKKLSDEGKAASGLRCDVVTFYHGARYHLYYYKEFTDVRLVFTPEESVGFFGGDPDNFEYPRYNLDVTIFRAYENDEPYHPEHFLKWSENGAQDGEFTLVAGYPARTNRLNTVADLQYQRDVYYPHMMNKYRRREVLYQVFGSRNEENARRVATDLFKIQNSRKNRGGILLGLQTPELMQRKIDAENDLRQRAGNDEPWKKIEEAVKEWANVFVAYDLLESGEAFYSPTVARARAVVRYITEAAKPEAERNAAYQGASLADRRKDLDGAINAPDADVEILRLGDSLSMLYELSQPVAGGRALGAVTLSDEVFSAIFDQLSPKARATQIVMNTKIADKAFRDALVDGGLDKLAECDDPAVKLALAIEPKASELRDVAAKYEETRRQEYAKIAKARFAAYGEKDAPDATFTMRLTYGTVCGYKEDDGTEIPFETTIKGALDHAREHNCVDPYDLAQSWFDAEKEGRAPLDAQINFVTNHDIIGGNSGSPCVNTKGEVVGLIFDGNIQSLVLNFIFDEVQARAVLVHSNGIRAALRDIYQMPQLADELGK